MSEKQRLLPDKWGKIYSRRTREYNDETLKTLLSSGDVAEQCLGCAGLRTKRHGQYMVTYCVFDKCIRRYPHIRDKKEFK